MKELKALIVDDSVDNYNLIEFLLQREGIATLYVTSVGEALEVYRLLQPDILITDLDIPGGSGFALLRQLRALSEDGKQIPAIALTGYTSEEVRLEARKAGFQRFITKPFEIDELLTAVTELLNLNSIS